jgi:hypothetical protein
MGLFLESMGLFWNQWVYFAQLFLKVDFAPLFLKVEKIETNLKPLL